MFCNLLILGVFSAQHCKLDEDEPTPDALITIMNADGIYLATYAALLLNLKLLRTGYYENESRLVPINEVDIKNFYLKTISLKFTVLLKEKQNLNRSNLLKKCMDPVFLCIYQQRGYQSFTNKF